MKSILLLHLFLSLFSTTGQAGEEGPTISIGIRACGGEEMAKKSWEPTIDYLNQEFPEYIFKATYLVDYENMWAFVENKKIDFLISDPLFYMEMESRYGATRIATLERKVNGIYVNKFGSVFFTHADNKHINRLRDLKNKKIVALSENAFAGWRTAQRELLRAGLRKEKDYKLHYVNTDGINVVEQVLSKKHDVGVIRTGMLEKLTTMGKINANDFKIIDPKQYDYYPELISTRLYPEFAFSKMSHVSNQLGEKILISLFKINENDPSAKAAGLARWSLPGDYSDIVQMMKELKIGVYQNWEEITPLNVFKKYTPYIISFWSIIFAILFLLMTTMRMNRELIARVKREVERNERQGRMMEVRSRQAQMGEMLSAISHQWFRPLDIINILGQTIDGTQTPEEALKLGSRISKQVQKMAQMMRDYVQFFRDDAKKEFYVKETVEKIYQMVTDSFYKHQIQVSIRGRDDLLIQGCRNEFMQIVLTILANAKDIFEIRNPQVKKIDIDIHLDNNHVQVVIQDTAGGIDENIFDKIFEPYVSGINKVGLGLHTCKTLIEKEKGHITCANIQDGACFIITWPLFHREQLSQAS